MTHKQEYEKKAAEAMGDAAHYIVCGFGWAETPEGTGYWAAQHKHLLAMSRMLRKRAES